MFYHLKITLRNLHRGGIYSFINVGGLTIGMAAAILILAWIYHEWSYDRFHAKEKQLYAVYNRATFNGVMLCWSNTTFILGATLKEEYPEIAGMTRILDVTSLFSIDDANFKIQTGYADPDFLSMFDFPLLQGDKETALNDPYSVILTEKAALRLFGRDDPVGKMLKLDNQYSMAVTGVMKDLPGNTRFNFEALIPMSLAKVQGRYHENWDNNWPVTYVELHPNARPDLVNESIRSVIRSHTNDRVEWDVFLYPLTRQHLYSKFENGVPVGGLIESLRMYGIIASLILLIACINFMNLSTARSAKRAKEVGVRKVLGGKRRKLVGQFLGESITVAFIASAAALVLALMALPVFSALMGKQSVINLTDARFWLAWLGFVLITGLLAGSYPAFYLSSFLPVKVLKGLFKTRQAVVSPRKVLVVVQFTVACTLIVSSLVIHRQIKYVQDREWGYEKDRLIYTDLNSDITKNYELIRQDLMSSGAATSVTKNNMPMTQRWSNIADVAWQGHDPNTSILFDVFFTCADWIKTVGATLIEGRDIDVYTYATDSTAMILNEAALKIMNFKNPIGETVRALNKDWHVVGVVKDFIISSPYQPIEPMLIGGPSGWFNVMHIKLNGQNRTAENLAKAERIFKQYNSAYPFEYHFVDEEYARKFGEEQKLRALTTWFAGLTIFISCLGLFALVAYMAETRRKEIGIRKVLGASVSGIMLMLSKEFLILVLISVAVASPIAQWIMNQWLANYAYRTNIPWWLFVVVGCLSLGIALVTVGFQAVRAAMANPVKAIKSE